MATVELSISALWRDCTVIVPYLVLLQCTLSRNGSGNVTQSGRSIAWLTPSDIVKVIRLKSCMQSTLCQDLHSYAHMQMVATELGRHQHGGSFRRLSQELEKLAAEQHGELVWCATARINCDSDTRLACSCCSSHRLMVHCIVHRRMNEAFAGFSVSEAHQHAAALVGELLQVGEDSIGKGMLQLDARIEAHSADESALL